MTGKATRPLAGFPRNLEPRSPPGQKHLLEDFLDQLIDTCIAMVLTPLYIHDRELVSVLTYYTH